MAERSGIAWTHGTFNPWIGCRALSPACDNCYAETFAKRYGRDFSERTRTSANNWKNPIRWNRKAMTEGRRMRVFCASLADVFDPEVPAEWRNDLFALIDETPYIDWLLLTKRSLVARKTMPQTPRPNVWLGTTVENQRMAEARIPHLLSTPAAVRFLSMEPLLGPVDLFRIKDGAGTFNALSSRKDSAYRSTNTGIDWVIVGGESGPKARPMPEMHATEIRQQCATAGVPFFMKQMSQADTRNYGDFDQFPSSLQVRELPRIAA